MSSVAAEAISTRRLDLVPLHLEHADEMAVVLADPGLYTYTGGSPPTATALRTRYKRLIAGSPDPAVSWCNWVIHLRSPGCLVGTVQATISNREPPVAEVAWVTGTPWQGHGIATEAAQALVAWLGRQPVQHIIAHIHPRHRASAAVAAACGLSPTSEWHDGERRWSLTP